jgi:hypothetical protein
MIGINFEISLVWGIIFEFVMTSIFLESVHGISYNLNKIFTKFHFLQDNEKRALFQF